MNDGEMVAHRIDRIKKISEIYENEIKIIKTDMDTNKKEEIISKNIESITFIMENIINLNKIIIKDSDYNDIKEIHINDDNPYFFETKEDGFDYIIIYENKCLHKILYNNIRDKNESKNESKNENKIGDEIIPLNMNIFLILKIKEKEYIISCTIGTYNYEGSLFEICAEKLEDNKKIFDNIYKNGLNIDNRFLILVDNDKDKGIISIYDLLTKEININDFEGNYFIYETLTIINYDENKMGNKIILCACEDIKKDYGILIIRIESSYKIQIFDIIKINFNIKFLCSLKNIIIIENSNTKIFDIKYFIAVGENEKKIEMKVI